jgi:hypothetical protein
MEFRYGMRLRGFAPMCQPKEGFVRREDDLTGKYYDILVYNRELTDKEVRNYELDGLNASNSNEKVLPL